jgi:hypothetical protein
MNKLWVFGDSFSEPFSKGIPKWKNDYTKWKGYVPKCYGEIVADELKLVHMNRAIGGTDNYTIFDSIIDVINSISEKDIIIIGWSSTTRFRIVNNDNLFVTIRPGFIDDTNYFGKSKTPISESSLLELIVNRDSSNYIDELNNYIKLINFSFPNNKIIHWSPFPLDKNGLNVTFPYSNKYETISKESAGLVIDAHYGENGHLELSKTIIDVIDSYQTIQFKRKLV